MAKEKYSKVEKEKLYENESLYEKAFEALVEYSKIGKTDFFGRQKKYDETKITNFQSELAGTVNPMKFLKEFKNRVYSNSKNRNLKAMGLSDRFISMNEDFLYEVEAQRLADRLASRVKADDIEAVTSKFFGSLVYSFMGRSFPVKLLSYENNLDLVVAEYNNSGDLYLALETICDQEFRKTPKGHFKYAVREIVEQVHESAKNRGYDFTFNIWQLEAALNKFIKNNKEDIKDFFDNNRVVPCLPGREESFKEVFLEIIKNNLEFICDEMGYNKDEMALLKDGVLSEKRKEMPAVLLEKALKALWDKSKDECLEFVKSKEVTTVQAVPLDDKEDLVVEKGDVVVQLVPEEEEISVVQATLVEKKNKVQATRNTANQDLKKESAPNLRDLEKRMESMREFGEELGEENNRPVVGHNTRRLSQQSEKSEEERVPVLG